MALQVGVYCTFLSAHAGCSTPREIQTPEKVDAAAQRELSNQIPNLIEQYGIEDVGDGPLDLLACLRAFNLSVERNALPEYCSIILHTYPEALGDQHVLQDITEPGYIEGYGYLEPLSLPPGRDIRNQIEDLNLREFLWLVRATFNLDIMYTPVGIEVGYGWTAGQALSPR